MVLYTQTSKLHLQEKQFSVTCVHFKLYLGNWMNDGFGICSVARSKVAFMIFYMLCDLQNSNCLSQKINFVGCVGFLCELRIWLASFYPQHWSSIARMYLTEN